METVAVYLGANRSLTTISSAMLALHPAVTVLNHAYVRIFANPAHDFLRTPQQPVLDAFVRSATDMALGGERGAVGGHILHSHAFTADEALRHAYLDRHGWGAKPATRCLLWKDATRLTNHIGEHRVDVCAVARALPSLRFIMIVRNPVDIAISSINKGYASALVGDARKDDFGEVFGQMLRRFHWFSRHVMEQPDQFRFLYQDEMLDRDHLISLCAFLRIPAPESWLDDIARLIRLRESYPITEEQKTELRALTTRAIPDTGIAQRIAQQIV